MTEAGGEIHHLDPRPELLRRGLATKVRGSYQPLPSALGKAYGMVIRRPMGVVAAIIPNNFPLTLLGAKLAGAVAGNTVVVKPAATTPLTTLKIADLLLEAGVPARRGQRHHRPGLRGRRRARHPRPESGASRSRARRRWAATSWPRRAQAEAPDDWSWAARTR